MRKTIAYLFFILLSLNGTAQISKSERAVFESAELKKENPFIYYSYKGDIEKVKELLKTNPSLIHRSFEYDPNQTIGGQLTVAAVKLLTLGLLNTNAELTAMDAALAGNHFDIVKLLLNYTHDPEKAIRICAIQHNRLMLDSLIGFNQSYAYYLALYGTKDHGGDFYRGAHRYLRLAIETYHFDPNSSPSERDKPLIFQRSKLALNYLLSLNGIDVNKTDDEGNTAIMSASEHRDSLSFTLLLKAGADLNVMNKKGYTLLDKVTEKEKNARTDTNRAGYLGSANLIRLGARSSGWSGFRAYERGNTFYYSVLHNFRSQIEKMSLDTFPIKFRDPKRIQEIARISVDRSDLVALNMLKACKFDWNDSTQQGFTFLEKAVVWQKNMELAKFLIAAGAKVSSRDRVLRTLIHRILNSDLTITDKKTWINILNKAGVDINAADDTGKTALMYALDAPAKHRSEFSESDQAMVEFLLSLGADINAKDTAGTTIMDRLLKDKAPKTLRKFIQKKGGLTSTQLEKAERRKKE